MAILFNALHAHPLGVRMKKQAKITIAKDGPYLVEGNVTLERETAVPGEDGDPLRWEKGKPFPKQAAYALCRCGHSKGKPYCDGTHTTTGFDGTETATKKTHAEMATHIEGPGLDLEDAVDLCMGARFCHRAGQIWNLIPKSDDPDAKRTAIEEAFDCPSGRLVVVDKKAGPLEPKFKPSISVTQDPGAKVSGPLWVKGGILIASASGYVYEVRNRITLCRCGRSNTKPLCDESHKEVGFSDHI